MCQRILGVSLTGHHQVIYTVVMLLALVATPSYSTQPRESLVRLDWIRLVDRDPTDAYLDLEASVRTVVPVTLEAFAVAAHEAHSVRAVCSPIQTSWGDNAALVTAQVTAPTRDGQHFFEMGVNATPVAPGMKFVPHYRFALYTQVEGGIILAQSQQPILNELAPVAPSDRGVPGKTNGPQTASYTVNVYISGRVTFVSNHAVWKGVSDVPVYLRWGGTPTLTGGLPPGHPEGLHQSYDIADRDGYFVFNYSFQSNVPAHELAEHILVYAGMANSAAYDGDAGVGAPFTEFLAIPIDGITTTITVPDTNYAVNGVAGSALRYLYHAKQFALQRFGMSETQLNLMMYKRRTGGTTHFTAPHSSSEQYVEFIELEVHPESWTRVTPNNCDYSSLRCRLM